MADGALGGGACSLKAVLGWGASADVAKADWGSATWTPGVNPPCPSSMSDSDLYADGGNRGDIAYCEKDGDLGPKPGVLGAD